jgi:AhpD family alkylhydroperoxidase
MAHDKSDLITVTGAGGFIGGSMVSHLRRTGHKRLRAIDIKSQDEWYQRFDDVENHSLDLNLIQNCEFAAKGAAAIMGMNNIYYRFTHLSSNEKYGTMRAGLRMNVIRTHGIDQLDFELWCISVSAINGCGACVDSHDKVLREKGFGETYGKSRTGEWEYVDSLTNGPFGQDYALSSAGLGLAGGMTTFPGANLQGPTNMDGVQYGITSQLDNPATGNAAGICA